MKFTGNIIRYDKDHESELIALLESEPDWNAFVRGEALGAFKAALLSSKTYIYKSHGEVCGYLRALVDEFGICVSELYVAPRYRCRGFGRELLGKLKKAHPNQSVYVLSDEDGYYEKLGCRRIGSVFEL
ncbi:GNAT family N-acetyltransferase [Halomonas daqingensis]|uniref:GNAT family N-acetyltransferase n=1 Tax=Billgrantia desiderata TaxID=52021 RepID=A0ABS9BA82_9GAMM|nr:GNAT family N-acetyltransferase [Halomonas desiderata]MCE8044218.1 GNAT family N-acetyltransferase [Halomonas desiderata]MCE8048792.1 GNAT family N-acetyltransferase [Halomonas desiderata]